MTLPDENPSTFDECLDDLIQEFLDDGDLTLGEIIEILAGKTDELRLEEQDHARIIEPGQQAKGE